MQTVADFVAEVDAFLARSGMTPTAFGRAAVSDPNFVSDVRDGRAPSLRMVERVHTFIKEHETGSSGDDNENRVAAGAQ